MQNLLLQLQRIGPLSIRGILIYCFAAITGGFQIHGAAFPMAMLSDANRRAQATWNHRSCGALSTEENVAARSFAFSQSNPSYCHLPHHLLVLVKGSVLQLVTNPHPARFSFHD